MKTLRPAYIEDRIALETKRREHRREAPKGCRCPFCLDRAGFAQLVKAALARNESPSSGRHAVDCACDSCVYGRESVLTAEDY